MPSRLRGLDSLPPFAAPTSVSALQRKELVDAGGRTHGIRHQAAVRFGHPRRRERQLYEVQLTSGCDWVVSLLRRLIPCRANWRCRPVAACRRADVVSRKQPLAVLGPEKGKSCDASALP